MGGGGSSLVELNVRALHIRPLMVKSDLSIQLGLYPFQIDLLRTVSTPFHTGFPSGVISACVTVATCLGWSRYTHYRVLKI